MTSRVEESPYLEAVESGNGVRLRLHTCPLCQRELDETTPARHVDEYHDWADIERARRVNRRTTSQNASLTDGPYGTTSPP